MSDHEADSFDMTYEKLRGELAAVKARLRQATELINWLHNRVEGESFDKICDYFEYGDNQ